MEFASSTSCRDASEFTRWLQSFTKRVRPAEPGEPALTFVVRLVPTELGVGGRLTLREIDGKESLREVPGPNCHEVILGMALIGALTVDPLAIIPSDVRRPPPLPPVARPAPPPESAAREPEETSPWALELGQRAGVQTAVAPGFAWNASLYAGVAYALDDVVYPSVRLAAHGALRESSGHAGGDARFTWLAARLSLCPVRWAPSEAVTFRPCAIGDAGRLEVAGLDTEAADDPSIFWSAAGLELEFQALIAGPLSLGMDAGVLFPFQRDLFFFASNEVVHEIPAAGLTASAGFALRFF